MFVNEGDAPGDFEVDEGDVTGAGRFISFYIPAENIPKMFGDRRGFLRAGRGIAKFVRCVGSLAASAGL